MKTSFQSLVIRPVTSSSKTLWGLVSCLVGLPSAFAAPGSWSRGADLPVAISTPAACAVDDVLYVIGGHDRSFRQLDTVFAYHPKTDSWSRKAPMPTARRWLAAEAVDGVIYAVGGGGWRDPVVRVVEAYDPRTDRWTARAPMPTGRFTFAACAVGGILYAIGGGDDSMNGISTVEAYDPKTDRWTSKRPLPRPGGMLVATALNGLIYVCRGMEVFLYDPSADRWTTRAPFPVWRQASMIAAMDGTLFVFGGCEEGYFTTYDTVTAYDPVSGQVAGRRRMPRTRAWGAGVTLGDKVYLVGGASQEPILHPDASFHDALDVFDPRGGVEPRLLAASLASPTALRLTWQAEAGQRYGILGTEDAVHGPWRAMPYSTLASSVMATNGIMEAVGMLPEGAPRRFIRLVEVP